MQGAGKVNRLRSPLLWFHTITRSNLLHRMVERIGVNTPEATHVRERPGFGSGHPLVTIA
jgi:hypothetical protein